jgi:hypothetical protein
MPKDRHDGTKITKKSGDGFLCSLCFEFFEAFKASQWIS